MIAVLAAQTNTHGILFDRPDVVSRAQPVLEAAGVARRCAVVGGSFFGDHSRGWRRILIKYILHDWDDAASLATPGSIADGYFVQKEGFLIMRTDRRRSEWTPWHETSRSKHARVP